MSRPIAIASDHGGKLLKAKIVSRLAAKGIEVLDFGVPMDQESSVDYPLYAKEVATCILEGKADRGILVCGSGIGVSIAANRFKGIRATLAWNEETARLSRQHNHSNVLCLGERVIEHDLALRMVDLWLNEHVESRHQHRVDLLDQLN